MGQPMQQMSREQRVAVIARACHEANRSWCADHGDSSQQPWFSAAGWQRESALKGVEFALQGRGPEAQHEAWTADKLAEGWTHGPVKDPVSKTHPCLVPYDELPLMQKAKDSLFLAIVGALAPPLGLAGPAGSERRDLTDEEIAAAEGPFFNPDAAPKSDPRCAACPHYASQHSVGDQDGGPGPCQVCRCIEFAEAS